MKQPKHSNDPVCTRCNKLLEEADTDLAYWVFVIRSQFLDAHISCTWRGEADQNLYFKEGKSQLKWPHSKHNTLNEKGEPCARAIDLFKLEDGKAKFPIGFYLAINHFLEDNNAPIQWGGDWKKFKDYPHFELKS